MHDKKAHGGLVDAIFVEDVGSYEIRRMTQDEFMRHVITETARIKA